MDGVSTNEQGAVRTVTDATFAEQIEAHDGVAMVDFWASWCGPCRMVAPVVEQLAGEYEGRLRVAKLDVDANPESSQRFGIRSIPAILFFRDGALVDTVVGAVPRSVLQARIEAHL